MDHACRSEYVYLNDRNEGRNVTIVHAWVNGALSIEGTLEMCETYLATYESRTAW